MEVESRRMTGQQQSRAGSEPLRNLVAWWLLGLLNNSAYVVMIAGANNISSAAVGLVYLCAVLPSLICKASGPYWFHLVRYTTRMWVAALLMTCSYTTVALSSNRGWQLLGVVFASLQGGLGEASCLALTSYYSGRPAITMWSSGTGFAGVFGYAWVALLHVIGGLSFRSTLLLANATTLGWLAVYHLLLESPERRLQQLWRHESDAAELAVDELDGGGAADISSARWQAAQQQQRRGKRLGFREAVLDAEAVLAVGGHEGEEEDGEGGVEGGSSAHEQQRLLGPAQQDGAGGVQGSQGGAGAGGGGAGASQQQQLQRQQQQQQQEEVDDPLSSPRKPSRAARMTGKERLHRTLVLWPYMVPLLLVYFAEYAMQSGTWTAIGFPVTSAPARHRFYVYSNWTYQAGVAVSRSSGMLYQASRRMLWAMPIMQVGWLAFFLADAVLHFWYNYWLMLPCFVTGLLGGAVYVNAFTLISNEVPSQYREFSLGAASLADSLGVALADACGIIIQGCLFRANGLPGADFSCS